MSIEAMKQALEYIMHIQNHVDFIKTNDETDLLNMLKQSIEQADKQEPVCDKSPRDCSNIICNVSGVCKNSEPLANPIANQQKTSGSPIPVACKHKRYSNDVTEDTATCYDCGAEGRMRFVANDTSPPQAEKQEPVALYEPQWADPVTPLYTAPPRKEWVGLTGEELAQLTIDNAGYPTRLTAAIEAKLKEKNGGS